MVVLSPVVDCHIRRGVYGGGGMANLLVHVLPQGARAGSERPQAEGAEGSAAEQTGVRGHLHDRGQGLGRRTHLRPNHHRTDTGEYRPEVTAHSQCR